MVPILIWRSFGEAKRATFSRLKRRGQFSASGFFAFLWATAPLFPEAFKVFRGSPYSSQRNLLPVFRPFLSCMFPPTLARLLLLCFFRLQEGASVRNKILETLMVRGCDAGRIRTHLESIGVVFAHEQN